MGVGNSYKLTNIKTCEMMETYSSYSRFWAFLAYLLSVIGFVIIFLVKKHDRFAKYHAKQSLILFIAYVVVWIVAKIINFIPFLGILVSSILWITIVVLWIIGIVNALSGKEKPLPIIGEFAHRLNI